MAYYGWRGGGVFAKGPLAFVGVGCSDGGGVLDGKGWPGVGVAGGLAFVVVLGGGAAGGRLASSMK